MHSFWLLQIAPSRASFAAISGSPACAPPACISVRALPISILRAPQPCRRARQRPDVVCMAHPRRVARVASQIQREIGDMFVSDPVIQAAICPERRLGDNTLSAVASITNTYVSNDLQVVKVFVSVYSDNYGKRVAMQNLQRLAPYVRSLIGQRVRLRLTPEIRFVYDDTEEEADLVARVIGQEEVQRYRSEIEAEMTPAARRQEKGHGKEQDGEAATAIEGEEQEDGDEQDENEYEEVELYEDPDEAPQVYPTPFADMFKGDDQQEMQKGRRQDGQQETQKGRRRG